MHYIFLYHMSVIDTEGMHMHEYHYHSGGLNQILVVIVKGSAVFFGNHNEFENVLKMSVSSLKMSGLIVSSVVSANNLKS
jgi:hypothetical protein